MTGVLVVIAFLAGLLAGVGLVVAVLKRAMIKATASQFPFEDTERRLREGAAPGWGFPVPELDFVAALAKKGFAAANIKRAKIFFLCNPGYAAAVVGAEHRMMGMMPCHWALYETGAGKVFLARLNLPLLSRMFGGVVGRTMAQVARDELSMVPRIVAGKAATGGTGATPVL